VGLALALAVAWYVHYCYQEIRGTAEVVIDPFTVVESSGKRAEDVGGTLALMLQVRLESLTEELAGAQQGLNSAPSSPTDAVVAPVGDVRLWTRDVALHTGLLQPVQMKLSVYGVEVGGVIPWLQRRLSNRRTLHFSVYSRGNEAQVFGSVDALGFEGKRLKLVVKGDDGTPPSYDAIVDRLAHEIVRRRLALDPSNRVELLSSDEFVTLSDVLVAAADSNHRALSGRPVQNEFVDLLPRITALSDQVPDWPELGYFAAWVADKARDSATASSYYRRVVTKLDATKQNQLIAFINGRLHDLAATELSSAAVAAVEPTKPVLDYSDYIKHVRNQGNEGSVIGQALATAMEFQIARSTHQDRQISARYIYYAARERAGTTGFDGGAQLADAISVLSERGAVEESIWPYVPGQYADKPPVAVETAKRFHIIDAKVVKGLDGIKKALNQSGPVVAGVSMYQSAFDAEPRKTGIVPLPNPKKERMIGRHGIVIVGYNDNKKLVKFVNSWGPSWGENGFGFLPYDYVEKYVDEAWTFKVAAS
jgi:hypothetical protein